MPKFKKGHTPANMLNPDLNPTPKLAYILGVLKGDGGVYCYELENRDWNRYEISLGTKSKEFNLSFEKALKSIGLNPSTYFKSSNQAWTTIAQSKVFCEWYESLDLEKIEKMLSKDKMKKGFIRGFYESEGCISCREGKYRVDSKGNTYYDRRKYEISISNANGDLIALVLRALKELGLDFYYSTRELAGQEPKHEIGTGSQETVRRFLREISPCIKKVDLDLISPYETPKGKESHNWKGGKFKSCSVCGSEFWVSPSQEDVLECCSMECRKKKRKYVKHSDEWTQEEDQVIRRYYPSAEKDYLLERLGGRSWGAIQKRASRLKVHRNLAQRKA